ncbi:MAG: helix-turn-helix domain-containing protein [Frankia sp.]
MERAAETAEEWADSVARSFVPLRVNRLATDFTGLIRERSLARGVRISAVRCGASELARTAKAARGDQEPLVLFVTHRSGHAGVEQGGRSATQRPGQSVLYTTNRPYELRFPTAIDEQVLSVPARALTTRLRDVERLAARSIDAAAPVRVLRACLDEIAASAPGDHESGLADMAASLLDVVFAALLGERRSTSKAVLARSVRQFIADHAHDPRLDPSAVAAAFHLSRRSLYDLLQQESASPGELIRRERTAQAARLLQTQEAPVESIGSRCGFTDARTFSRAFASVYGVTPGVYRREHRAAAGSPGPAPGGQGSL